MISGFQLLMSSVVNMLFWKDMYSLKKYISLIDNAWSSSQIAEREDSKDGTLSNLCSALESQNIESDSVLTFTQVNKVIDNLEQDSSPPSDTKSAYSSVVSSISIFFIFFSITPLL